MKNICMIFLLLSLSLFADITMKKSKKEKPEIVLPIHPIRPIVNTGIVYQDNSYNEHYTSNCQHYIDILAEKDKEILTLRSKLANLQNSKIKNSKN